MSAMAQWFNPHSPCRGCGRKAAGTLMGYNNQDLGCHCRPCADKAIKKAHKKHGQFAPDSVVDYNVEYSKACKAAIEERFAEKT
jgi:hypothetical protein